MMKELAQKRLVIDLSTNNCRYDTQTQKNETSPETKEEEVADSEDEAVSAEQMMKELAQKRVVIDLSTNNCRYDTQTQKNETSPETKEEEVADSEDEAVSAEQMMKDLETEKEEKGISMEEYTMFQKLAQKRVVIDQSTNNCRYDTQTQKNETSHETKEEEGEENNLANMFRGAMDLAISNFFGSGQPAIYRTVQRFSKAVVPDHDEDQADTSTPASPPTPEQPQQEQPQQQERRERREHREPYPPVPTTVVTGPFSKSLHGLDDETCTLSCGEYEDTRSFNNQDDTNKDFHLKQLELYEQQEDEFTEEESRRVPAVIVQYDLQSTTNDELTVESRDFPPLSVDRDWDVPRESSILRKPKYSGCSVPVALGRSGMCLSRQRRRLVSKRPNRTVGPDDESTASEDSLDSLGSAIEQMEIKFSPEVEESQIDASVKGLVEDVY
jgi:hypothetical protein